MTTGWGPGAGDPRGAPLEPCPCGHGDVAAEIERQRPLIAGAIQGDPEALAVLYDDHVDDVYRYLLAWTWDSASARNLTERVFRGAVAWLPAITEGKGELGAWLIALARDAVGQHRATGWAAQPQAQPQDAFDVVERLDDAQREVVVLRLLLGHSVAHTAHLAGYDSRVVQELQLAACATIWQLLDGVPLDPPPDGREDLRPRWFEHFLAGAGVIDPAADPGLASALSIADALRQGAADHVPLPDDGFVAGLRSQLLHSIAGELEEVPPAPVGRLGRAFAAVRFHIARHPWAATSVAAGAIGVVLGLQLAGGGSPARSNCAGETCVSTTAASAASEEQQGTLPTVPVVGGEATTTSGHSAAPSTTRSRPSTTRASTPSTTVPPTTVPRTTRTTQATTTTRRRGPPSTRPTTTEAPTTTLGGDQTTSTTRRGP
jgi:DNA-directed RNA polymerase specialized sigma24 family protein